MQIVFFEQPGEKSLRQVLSVRRFVSLAPHKKIKRLPISAAESLQSFFGRSITRIARVQHHRPHRGRKLLRSESAGFWIHTRHRTRILAHPSASRHFYPTRRRDGGLQAARDGRLDAMLGGSGALLVLFYFPGTRVVSPGTSICLFLAGYGWSIILHELGYSV